MVKTPEKMNLWISAGLFLDCDWTLVGIKMENLTSFLWISTVIE